MYKKNLLLAYALLAAAYIPAMIASDDADMKGKCNKCCKCASLTVSGNSSLAGTLSVSGATTVGSLTATGNISAPNFITPAGALFNGLRNYAVFSNQAAVADAATVPFDATPVFSNSTGITNAAGDITLPVGGAFLVMYTIRVEIIGNAVGGTATAQLQQGNGTTFAAITQPAVINSADLLPVGTDVETQISGYAIVTTTSTSNNQINLLITLSTSAFTVPAALDTDANAQITILQLN